MHGISVNELGKLAAKRTLLQRQTISPRGVVYEQLRKPSRSASPARALAHFNEAAAIQLRKRGARPLHIPHGSVASMRPQLFSCGSDPRSAHESRHRAASMRPQLFSCGSGSHARRTVAGARGDASMRPQLFSCGSRDETEQAESRDHASIRPQLFSCGSDDPDTEQRPSHHASIRPQLFSCGNANSS